MKKGEVEKEIRSASKAQILFLKGPQEGPPTLAHHVQRVMAWRGLGQILTCGSTQPELVWLYKQDLETVLWSQTYSGVFWGVFCCFGLCS